MKVVITGSTGFIGINLVEELYNKHELVLLVRSGKSYPQLGRFPKAKIVAVNFDNQKELEMACKGSEIVVHLAGLLPNSTSSVKEIYSVNAGLAGNMIRAAIRSKSVKQFILCSTAFIDWFAGMSQPKETVYTASKLEGEKVVKQEASGAKIPLTIIRPGFIYGEGNPGMFPIFKLIKSGLFFYVGTGTHDFELTHVRDLTRFIKLVINNRKAFDKTFIVSCYRTFSFKQFVESISKALNVRSPSRHLSPTLVKIGLKIVDLTKSITKINLPISMDTFYTFTCPQKFDVTAAKRELNFETNMDQGKEISKLVKSFTILTQRQ